MRNLLWTAAALFTLTVRPASGQDPRYRLDVEGDTPGKEVVVTRPRNGLFPLRVILNAGPPATGQPAAPPPKPVYVTMSLFSGDRGTFAVQILAACDPQAPAATQPMDFTSSKVQALCLEIPPVPGDGKYTGNMLLVSDDTKPLLKPFAITRSQAALAVQPISPQWVTLPFFSRFASKKTSGTSPTPQQEFTIVLSEKSGTTSADGIMVKLTTSKSPAGLDLKKNMAFKVRGQDIPDLESGPPTDAAQRQLRTVPAGGQLGIDVSLFGLMPGEYDAVLQFSSPNSLSDDSQKQSLVIQVRDPMAWAILWLVAAVSVSFFATKVLVGLSRRANLKRQIHDATPQWLSGMDPIFPVVWVRAVLHQAKKLTSRFWLTSPDLIDTQITGVRSMVKILDQAHQLRSLLTRALDPFLLRRVMIDLTGVLPCLDAGAPDDATATRIQAELKTFEDWLDQAKILTKFQSDVVPHMQALENDIAAGPNSEAFEQAIAELRRSMQDALARPPQTIGQMNDVYRRYVRLRAIWEDRANPGELIAATDVATMLDAIDTRDWDRLHSADADLKIRVPDSSSEDGLEAYVPLEFSVTADLDMAKSYLFKYKIEYAWTFILTPNKRSLREKLRRLRRSLWQMLKPKAGGPEAPEAPEMQKTITRRAVSLGPAMVQYFPRGGKVEVAVELRYKGDPIPVPGHQTVAIQESGDFGFFSAFAKVEVASWLIAAGAAIVTGLSTFYFKGPAFGSYQDYLTLFIWGAGVDQTKNFVQNMQAFSTTPPAGQGH